MLIRCPVCDGPDAVLLDRRADVPILMHRLFDTPEAARATPRVAIALRRCVSCGFAWNAAFAAETMVYGPDYDNAQAHSPEFQAHLDQRIDAIFASFAGDAAPLVLVEVGCGQGDFLARIMARHGDRIGAAFGFDPAWRGRDGEGPAGTRLYRRLFDASGAEALAQVQPDLVISRHTIEHIAEPMAFLGAIRAGIGARAGVRLFLETPDIGWILAHEAFEDVFYEHCSIFDAASLARALAGSGFAPVAVAPCFGDQYLWAEAVSALEPVACAAVPPVMPAAGIGSAALKAQWQARITASTRAGRACFIWGAGAKGMTFAQLVDPDQSLIAGLIDLNPGKQGRHIGMTGHQVLAPEALLAAGPVHLLVMNPNYADEIRQRVATLGVDAILSTLHGEQA